MTYTYTWTNAEKTGLRREDGDGNVVSVPANPSNRDYAEFLSSGANAADYVAPPEPEPLTAEEKLNAAGLTVEELRTLLELPEP